MNIDHQYIELLKDILENGIKKEVRTGVGTLSVFGRQLRHDMKEGFPLITTKKMYWGGIVTELLWFLRGDTDIRYLWKNNCHIWDGDWYKAYSKSCSTPYSLKEMIEFGLEWETNTRFFHKSVWELGPIYGKQWRSWSKPDLLSIDQIQHLINTLKTNPDSRRLMVNAWNVGELDEMVLPPCHYGFQVYTRELSIVEMIRIAKYKDEQILINQRKERINEISEQLLKDNIPTRAISLMWNQRSVDTFLRLPFNIASYGLLLEIIAKEVNMIPDQLIGNLGDTHLYLNHIEQAKEQIGRELSWPERIDKMYEINKDMAKNISDQWALNHAFLDDLNIPKRTREPLPLPKLDKLPEYFLRGSDWSCYEPKDIKLLNYKSHPEIKAPLNN